MGSTWGFNKEDISKMRTLLTEDFVEIPDDVTVTLKARKVTVKGKRGEVTKNFSHVACELKKMKQDTKKAKGNFIRIRMWFGGYKQACAVNTLKSLIENMITGVTEGYRYKMRLCYSHFPINATVAKDGSSVLVKNFLGGKQDKLITMFGGTEVRLTPADQVKDELVFEGPDNAAVSLCAALTNQVCKTGPKDHRKFLDGIYVSAKEKIEPKEE